MIRSERRIALAGSELTGVRHVCALFNSEEEEYRTLLPFIREGFEHGERAVHIVSPDHRKDHLDRLSSAGIDVDSAALSGQLEIRTSEETYLQNGRFDSERMVALFRRLASGNASAYSPPGRFVCRMNWAAGRTHADNLIEFESRVNDVWRCNDDAVICSYRLSDFSGDAIIDIVRTHPFVILGGVLRQNPFFVPPEEFLPELRARRRSETARSMDL